MQLMSTMRGMQRILSTDCSESPTTLQPALGGACLSCEGLRRACTLGGTSCLLWPSSVLH